MVEDSEIYDWLVEDLSMTKSPWKIVLMSHSIFLPDFHPEHYALAHLFERTAVSLVIASGRPYYMRTYPIGMFPERAVRHIVLPDEPDAQPAEQAAATWISHTVDEPLFGTLAASEAELSWRAYDRRGRLLDACNVGTELGPTSATRTVTIHDIRAARRDARKERQQ